MKVIACSTHEMAQASSDTHGLVAGHSYIPKHILITHKRVSSQMHLLPCLYQVFESVEVVHLEFPDIGHQWLNHFASS